MALHPGHGLYHLADDGLVVAADDRPAVYGGDDGLHMVAYELAVGGCRLVGTPATDDLVDGVVPLVNVVSDELDGGTDAVLHVRKLYEGLVASFDVPDLSYPNGGLHVLDVKGIIVTLSARGL